MQNFFGTCLAIGLLGGGFALTGDLGWLAARGLRVIQATDVPDDDAPIPVTSSAAPATSSPAPATCSAAALPPRTGPDAVAVASLAPGSRIRVWIRQPGHHANGACTCVDLDIVDPAAAEALAADVMPPSAPGQPPLAPAPPRRVHVRGSGTGGAIPVGGQLELEPRGIAAGAVRESLGPVVALDVIR